MGSNIAIKSEMIEITVSSSTNVKPFRLHIDLLLSMDNSSDDLLVLTSEGSPNSPM
jgi:hypothetical protein